MKGFFRRTAAVQPDQQRLYFPCAVLTPVQCHFMCVVARSIQKISFPHTGAGVHMFLFTTILASFVHGCKQLPLDRLPDSWPPCDGVVSKWIFFFLHRFNLDPRQRQDQVSYSTQPFGKRG